MEGAGRSARATAAAATKKKKNGRSDGSGSPRGLVVRFDEVSGVGDALRDRLAELGATAPAFVTGKTLEKSDVSTNQARLFLSCKRASLPLFPLTPCFTELEMKFVADDVDGLIVTALDRGGRSYDLTCRYLESNSGYRFITNWRTLVEDNGLRPGARVELWAFRSWQLKNRYEGKGKKKGPVLEDIGHPDGPLGLVVLDYGFDPQHGEAPPVQEMEEKFEAEPLEMERQLMKFEAVPPAAEKLAGGVGAASAEPTMTKPGMIGSLGFRTFIAAIGLSMLKRRRCD